VLDDGFQHRRAKRDLDIVCIDATDPVGKRTLLREPVSSLSRADAIILTRADLAENAAELMAKFQKNNKQARVFSTRTRSVSLASINDPTGASDKPAASFAFCALGNPAAFFGTLRQNALELAGTKAFRDHHRYTQNDIDDLAKAAAAAGADALLTTGKDAVKLMDLNFTLPCFVVDVETVVNEADEFRRLILTS
jgi:tetraacyldisaccharide 4'-kinase